MIRKAAINKMLELPDDKLVMMLRLVMGGAGMELPAKKIDGKSVQKLRALLEEITDSDLERLDTLVSVWKKGG